MQRLSAELRQRFPLHEWQPVTIGVSSAEVWYPNILLDPDTLELAGVVDVGRLGVADRYVDLALAARSLSSQELNPQYGPGAATRFLSRYGEDPPDEAKITFYCLLDEF